MVKQGDSWPPDEESGLPDFLAGDSSTGVSDDATDASSMAVLSQLQSEPLDDAMSAVETVHGQSLLGLQRAVAQLLYDRSSGLEFDQIERILDCLAAIGDGRCVRVMESILHERHFDLSEHQAWRARHIVQKIRRAGRK